MKWLPSIILMYGSFIILNGIFRGKTGFRDYKILKNKYKTSIKFYDQLIYENSKLAKKIENVKKFKNYAKKILRDKYNVLEKDQSIVFIED